MAYVAALDGIRAVAVLAVFLFHATVPGTRGGYLGVDIFFVLSGFLITTLLLREAENTGSIHLGRFYIRRLRRLMPALILLIVAYVALGPVFWPDYDGHHRDAALAGAYLSDYARAFWGVPHILRHTWSLAVEEHFYLLWPLALLWLFRFDRKRLLWMLVGLYLATTAWRVGWVATGQDWDAIYYRFDTRLSGLVLGALLALIGGSGHPMPSIRRLVPYATFAMFLVLIFVRWRSDIGLTAGVTVVEIATGILILSAVHDRTNGWKRLLGSAPAVFVGRVSYGLYLYHFPIVLYLRESHDWWETLAIGFPLSLVLAAMSYYAIERPILRRRALAVSGVQAVPG